MRLLPQHSQAFRVVQRKSDGRFYAGIGLWCDEVDSALRFHGAMQALEQCEELYDLSGEIAFIAAPEAGDLQLLVR